MPNNTLPLVVLINANGHRDTLELGTLIEFVLDKDRAIQVGIEPITNVNDVRVKVTEVRKGTLSTQPRDANVITIRSERKERG